MRNRSKFVILTGLLVLAGALFWFLSMERRPEQVLGETTPEPTAEPLTATALPTPTVQPVFDGNKALMDVETQVGFGPRLPGSPAQTAFLDWAVQEFNNAGWKVQIQDGLQANRPFKNLIAYRYEPDPGRAWVILGAHYDTRMVADQDPDPALRNQPVPGANDGASGVAVLLELARSLPEDPGQNVWIALFDIEDQGDLDGQEWSQGASAFVEELPNWVPDQQPQAVVIVDMIGDADLNVFMERNSNPLLSRQIWETAAALGYGQQFIAQSKYSMLDDHRPFLQAGIPAVLLIDFDYPYWHTVGDTADKLSAGSLQAVGDTLLAWLQTVEVPTGYP